MLHSRPRTRSRSRSPPRRRARYDDDVLRQRDYGNRDRRDNGNDRRDGRDRGKDRDRRRYDGPRDRDRDSNDARRNYSPRDRRDRSPRSLRYDDRDRNRDQRNGGDPGPSSSRAGAGVRSSSSRSRSPSPSVDKTKPNFNPSGLLAAETNTVKHTDGTSTFLKYNEPPEARKPNQSWRLYVFKGKEEVDLLHIHRQSCYLIGRDRTVCDIPLEHPSCSKQHAVIQFRHIPEKDEVGNVKATVKPFIIDLESTNGTFVNDEQIPESRYYELRLNDVVKFGLSLREYVLLHEDV